jgi:hypothetical protein
MNVKTALETLGLPDALVACADGSIGTPTIKGTDLFKII